MTDHEIPPAYLSIPIEHADRGQITEIYNLEPMPCIHCGDLAMWRVTRRNDKLPPPYTRGGKRNVYYCYAHTPPDVAKLVAVCVAP